MPVSYWVHGSEFLVSSSFGRTANRFPSAPPPTKRWWNRLKAWMDRVAVPLPTSDPLVTFWSFPFALDLMKRGAPYRASGWSLDDAMQRAKPLTPIGGGRARGDAWRSGEMCAVPCACRVGVSDLGSWHVAVARADVGDGPRPQARRAKLWPRDDASHDIELKRVPGRAPV